MSLPSLPSVEEAKTWVGSTVRASDATDLGTCVKVYADDATGVIEWLAVTVAEGRHAIVPAGGASTTGDGVQVAFGSEQVSAAPTTASLEHVETSEEASLYEHYGVPYSSAESPTLLPAEDAEEDATDAGEEAAAVTPAAVTPEIVPPETTYATPPTPVSAGSTTEWGIPAGGSSSKGPIAALAAAGGLAVAAVLGRRLLQRRKPDPATRSALASRAALRRAERASRSGRRAALRSGLTAAETLRRAGEQAKASAGPASTRAARSARSANRRAARAGVNAKDSARTAAAITAIAGKRSAKQVQGLGSSLAESGEHLTSEVLGAARRSSKNTAHAVTATAAPVGEAAGAVIHTGRTTMGLIKNALILGAGYVFGTRAGRERYEQIRDTAAQVWQRPKVQEATEKVKGTVSDRLPGRSGRSGSDAYADVATYPTTPPVVVADPVDPYATTDLPPDLPADTTLPTDPRP